MKSAPMKKKAAPMKKKAAPMKKMKMMDYDED